MATQALIVSLPYLSTHSRHITNRPGIEKDAAESLLESESSWQDGLNSTRQSGLSFLLRDTGSPPLVPFQIIRTLRSIFERYDKGSDDRDAQLGMYQIVEAYVDSLQTALIRNRVYGLGPGFLPRLSTTIMERDDLLGVQAVRDTFTEFESESVSSPSDYEKSSLLLSLTCPQFDVFALSSMLSGSQIESPFWEFGATLALPRRS